MSMASLLVYGSAVAAPAGLGWIVPLDGYPVCEASAALVADCVGAAGKCVWVADNEQEKQIFQYRSDSNGRLQKVASQWTIGIKDARIDDAEALAADEQGVLVVGSHSRNKDCSIDDDRLKISRITRGASGATRASLVTETGKDAWAALVAECATHLIRLSDTDTAAGPLRDQVCAAITATESVANEPGRGKANCSGKTFDIEGAVALSEGAPGTAPTKRLWLGLRAPLVGSKAILLRLEDGPRTPRAISFDGVALVDLRGKGIRELTVDGDSIWGIAGTAADSSEPSQLWRVARGALRSGAVIDDVELLAAPLPSTAEALVVESGDGRALILMDGDIDKDGQKCATPASQLVLRTSQ
jgi:hypothetical protein